MEKSNAFIVMFNIYMQQMLAVASVDCAIIPNQTKGFWNLDRKIMYLSPFAWSKIPEKSGQSQS